VNSALVDCEGNIVKPKINAKRNGRDTSLKYLHKTTEAKLQD